MQWSEGTDKGRRPQIHDGANPVSPLAGFRLSPKSGSQSHSRRVLSNDFLHFLHDAVCAQSVAFQQFFRLA